MSINKREVVFQRWVGVLQRETRDLMALDQISARALADSDVRDDPTLQSMIRAEVQKRRGVLEKQLQRERTATRLAKSSSAPDSASHSAEPMTTESPDEVKEAFNRLARALSTSLERGDDMEVRDTFQKMRVLQEQNPSVIPATVMGEYEQRITKLRLHAKQLVDEIAALASKAASASRKGKAEDLALSMRRLTAIQAAHPRLLDESGMEDIRRDVAQAADERRQHRETTKTILERERAITTEIKALATVVRDFKQLACTVPATTDAFRAAETKYLRTIETVRTYDTEWFSGVVLEMADLLAEWTVPPLGAEGQIDRFLDSITSGLDRIRADMREVQSKQDLDDDRSNSSSAP